MLLEIADRASTAEQAAARAVQARYAGTDPTPMVVVPPDGPVLSPTRHIHLSDELEHAHRQGRLAADRCRPDDDLPTVTSATTGFDPGYPDRPGSTGADLYTTTDLPTDSAVTASMRSPHPDPIDAPTTHNEFTALLDILRHGASPAEPTHTPGFPVDEPLVDESDAGLLPDPMTPSGETIPSVETMLPVETMPPVEPMPPAPAVRISRPPRIPAQGGPLRSEFDADDTLEAGPASDDARAAADRRTLRALGIPIAWTRLLRPGDRFSEVLRMLERMPQDDIDPTTPVVAVVGPAEMVRLEAHRMALDVATGDEPRPVIVVPASGPDRAAALACTLQREPIVLAVEADDDDTSAVVEILAAVQAGAVIAVVDAAAPLGRTQHRLDGLGQVDALVVHGATEVADPAAVLQLGLPVIRLDGIPVDRVTWTALLCAQLLAAETAVETASAGSDPAYSSGERAAAGDW
jgi:hypothetical protein